MVKCANCSLDAIFVYHITGTFSINYCSKHVPKFLLNAKGGSRLSKASAVYAPVLDIPVEETPAKTSKKKTSKVVEEPIEEPLVEEVVEAEPEALVEETLVEEAPAEDATN